MIKFYIYKTFNNDFLVGFPIFIVCGELSIFNAGWVIFGFDYLESIVPAVNVKTHSFEKQRKVGALFFLNCL
jgi:hypothetical protein